MTPQHYNNGQNYDLEFCELWSNINKENLYKSLRHKYGNDYADRAIFNDLKDKLRSRCSAAFKKIKENKPYNTEKILGGDFYTIKKHIENQFKENMNWNNMGKFGWHIDHIIPLALAKNKNELIKLCNYKNLQPLWWSDNFKKSSFYNGIKITYKNKTNYDTTTL